MTALNADDNLKELAADSHNDPSRPSFLQHHFDSAPRQFRSAKLGMWLFLGTELLFFGGLFCLYAVYRGNHPEIFEYGANYLNTWWGAANTVVLILSSVTMATAVTFAQKNRRRTVLFFLSLTLLGGFIFMGIKAIEYTHKIDHNLVWGMKLYENPHPLPDEDDNSEADVETMAVADPVLGKQKWMSTCRSCHGVAGEGITGQGKDIRASAFIGEKTDDELLAFVKVGRMPFDPLNTTGVQMPPRGGNPLLKDDDLRDIVAYVRSFHNPDGVSETADAAIAEAEKTLYIPRAIFPAASRGPAGLAPQVVAAVATGDNLHPSQDPNRPDKAHIFFNIYFMLTGLHGIHVLIGMGVIGWLILKTWRGTFSGNYFTPIDLGGLYWHLVDLIWIFLFPLLYLI